MKTINILSILFLLALAGCNDTAVEPKDTCKLSIIDRGNGNKHTYTYYANGKISSMAREFDGSGSGNISKYVYTFTYDGAGQLTKSTWTLDGKADGSESYTYTNGKISKTTYNYEDGSKGINNIKYDASGRLIEFTLEAGDPNSDYKQYFEYDVNGIVVKRGAADLVGNKFFEVLTKPIGSAKSPEVLLAKYGLPYDVLTGFGWQTVEGNVGTESEVFYADESGKLVSDGKDKIISLVMGSKGYISESTNRDASNKNTTQRFTMADCN
jgi:antitoxin component YwqK of YwqJK toxin-antitoxin module